MKVNNKLLLDLIEQGIADGEKCPKCKAKTKVKEVRTEFMNETRWRRRICSECGCNYKTIEIVIGV